MDQTRDCEGVKPDGTKCRNVKMAGSEKYCQVHLVKFGTQDPPSLICNEQFPSMIRSNSSTSEPPPKRQKMTREHIMKTVNMDRLITAYLQNHNLKEEIRKLKASMNDISTIIKNCNK